MRHMCRIIRYHRRCCSKEFWLQKLSPAILSVASGLDGSLQNLAEWDISAITTSNGPDRVCNSSLDSSNCNVKYFSRSSVPLAPNTGHAHSHSNIQDLSLETMGGVFSKSILVLAYTIAGCLAHLYVCKTSEGD